MKPARLVWLAATYHLPSTYSCRVPMSSMSSAQALPTPGPATVRLALLKSALELFGVASTRDVLFSVLSTMVIQIRPPERVALAYQVQHAFKASPSVGLRAAHMSDTVIYREVAHATGVMTVYIAVPEPLCDVCRRMLGVVGVLGTVQLPHLLYANHGGWSGSHRVHPAFTDNG